RARPKDTPLDRRLREGENRAVILGARIVLRDLAARGFLLRHIVARQVRAGYLPTRALVRRAEHVIAGDIEDVRIVRREHDRRGPVETAPDTLRAPAEMRPRPDIDVAPLCGASVEACDRATVAAGVDDVRIVRPDGDVAALAATDVVPLGLRDARHER